MAEHGCLLGYGKLIISMGFEALCIDIAGGAGTDDINTFFTDDTTLGFEPGPGGGYM